MYALFAAFAFAAFTFSDADCPSSFAYIRAVDAGLSVIVLTNREDLSEALSPLSLGWEALHILDPTIPADGHRCWE